MNPFDILSAVQDAYLTYVRTFQRFQNPAIRDWVLQRVRDGTLLWKPAYVQLSRPFAPGEALAELVAAGLLHPATPAVFRRDLGDPASLPIQPYRHQTDAVRLILGSARGDSPLSLSSPPFTGGLGGAGEGEGGRGGEGEGRPHNTVIATGTGSGKSFAFGIPIVSECLRARDRGVRGIKALIVYPMNALANSQYDDFAHRLHGTGVRLALYTGDTRHSPAEALEAYRHATGRKLPYDSEALSRQEVQENPPDILMTNYVMLELLLTRFEDRRLFATPGVLQFLVLDEVHTYSGKRGADVAALIRRLKQHTGTAGNACPEGRRLRCIATSATVQSEAGSAGEAIASFAARLFGEPFRPEDVVTEAYAPLPDDLSPLTKAIATALAAGPKTVPELALELGTPAAEIQQALLSSRVQHPTSNFQLPNPKLHAFFSQGRAITACLDPAGPHLNDRGELRCPACADEGRERPTFPLVFCRACGQEFYSVAWDEEGRLHPCELDAVEALGTPGYLYLDRWDTDAVPVPDNWRTERGNIQKRYEPAVPQAHALCPICGQLDGSCEHARRDVTLIAAPFLLCPNCGIVHDRRAREFNKLFTFGSVGRSTATDVLVSAQMGQLPERGRKVIAFSDNRQDTALQAAHMNSLHNRFAFRQVLYHTLREGSALVGSTEWLELADVGLRLFEAMERHGALPRYRQDQRAYGRDRQAEARYQRYLQFVTLLELRGTHRRTHQNLEDVGLLAVGYSGLDECAADAAFWSSVPLLADLDAPTRYDLLHGFLDLLRKRLAVAHEAALRPNPFFTEVLGRLNEDVFVHDEAFDGPIGYSDQAPRGYGYTVHRLTGSSTQLVGWIKRVLRTDHAEAVELIGQIVERLGDPAAGFLILHTVRGPKRVPYDLWMINPDVLTIQADTAAAQWQCPKCLTVHRFHALRVCTGSTCRTTLEQRDLAENYFRQVYTLPLDQAVRIQAEEHSGQVKGAERREIEVRFRDPDSALNVLVCTPTMELGIDIGHLNAVMLRNVPPSPSHYAQRAGRAGRSGQPSLITVFAGVGTRRGPHDQYFYRFPEKMIAGAIAAPRFRLDNRDLIWAHIHSLVLETMGVQGVERLPARPGELLDLQLGQETYPLHADWAAAYRAGIARHQDTIVAAVEEAFAAEMSGFDWFDRPFVERTVQGFVDDLDRALERWRAEYRRLNAEREELNRLLGTESVDRALNRRRVVIEGKLEAMREGQGDWYVYRYLGGEGFLPGYAFPPQAAVLSFDDCEDELGRDPAIALSEYAPGNFVYYRGQRYEVTHARPQTRQMLPDVEPVLVCGQCGRAYVGADQSNRTTCLCGQDLVGTHPRPGLALCDMYSQRRARITADEEERLRLGYEITEHYMAGGRRVEYTVHAAGQPALQFTVEHGGRVLLVNRGTRQAEGQPRGFTLCGKCHRWLMSEEAEQRHLGTSTQRGECSQNARPDDLLRGLWLVQTLQSDLALLDVPLPPETESEPFYTTLLHTLLRSLQVAFDLDESELGGFLAAGLGADMPYRIVLYETAVGGSGVLAALPEAGRLMMAVQRARELLHEGDPSGGCERACYECLLSFYNQRDHEWLDRDLVLPVLAAWEDLSVVPQQAAGETLADLEGQCQSGLERQVLRAIQERGLPLPDAAQKVLYDGDVPIASADFYYEPQIVIFVDGSPHYRDYVVAADETKRRRLKARGYRVLAITGGTIADALGTLAQWLGTR